MGARHTQPYDRPVVTAPAPLAVAPTTVRPANGALGRLRLRSAYLLTAFPLAMVAFVVLVVGTAVGAGLLVTLVG